MKILICGSREIDFRGVEYAKRCTLEAIAKGYEIVVGDAGGVDDVVIEPAANYPHITVVGANAYLRRRCKTGKNTTIPGSFVDRDKFMVEQADAVMCIWNGKSKGTRRNYDHACLEKKRAWLKKF